MCAPFKALGAAPKTFARIGYVCFQILIIIETIICMYLLNWMFNRFNWVSVCPDASGGGNECFGAMLIVRMSFALALLHTLVFTVSLLRNEMAAKFNEGCWLLKTFFVFGVEIASLWIYNDPFFTGYLIFSKWVSFVFLIFQSILMLIVAYKTNDVLISNVQKEGGSATSCSGIILISLTLILSCGNITWIVLQFIWFSSCTFHVWQQIFTCIAGVVMYGIIFFRTRPDASIFTSSLVLTYDLYL